MRARYLRALAFAAALIAVAAIGTAGATGKPTPAPSYKLANVGAYGGEPTIASNSKGELYDTTPSGGTLLYKSTNHGSTWTQATTADPSSGDDCVFTDQSNAVYECNLAGSPEAAPLQADVWKSLDDGNTWMYGDNAVNIVDGQDGLALGVGIGRRGLHVGGLGRLVLRKDFGRLVRKDFERVGRGLGGVL